MSESFEIGAGDGISVSPYNNSYRIILNEGFIATGCEFIGQEIRLTIATTNELPKSNESVVWINASEKMPENSGEYLAFNGNIIVSDFDGDRFRTMDGGFWNEQNPTHWAELPEPPNV